MTSYSTNVINISLLKQYQNTFSQDKDKFNNDAYATFRSSYLNTCSDGYVSRMSSQLNSLYSVIQNSYTSINDWWSNYNINAEGLENYLSTSYNSSLTENGLIGYINSKLPKLKEKVFDVSTFSYFNNPNLNLSQYCSNTSYINVDKYDKVSNNNLFVYQTSAIADLNVGMISGVNRFFNTDNVIVTAATPALAGGGSSILSGVDYITEKDISMVSSDFTIKSAISFCNVVESDLNEIGSFFESVGADICCAFLSLGEGFLEVCEWLDDTVAIAVTGFFSIFTGLFDLGQFIGSKITGKEYESVTKKMWKNTRAQVEPSRVEDDFDAFYDNNKFGKWVKENAYGFDTVRGIFKCVGQVAAIFAFSVATLGIGGVTTTISSVGKVAPWVAGTSGFGRGTQNAWADDSGTVEGLFFGTVEGFKEYASWWAGGKINQANWFMSKNVAPSLTNKVFNSTSKVFADSGVGALEAFAQPATQLYKDGYIDDNGNYIEFTKDDNFVDRYVQIFDDNGGFKSVGTNILLSIGLSSFGEISDVSKFVKVKNLDAQITNANNLLDTGAPATIEIDKKAIKNLPTELWDKIKNNDNLTFKIGNEELKYADVADIYNKYHKNSNIVSDSYKFKLENDLSIKDVEKLLEDKVEEYNKLLDIASSQDYKIYKENLSKGYAIEYNEIYHNLEKNMDELLYQIDELDLQYNKLVKNNKVQAFSESVSKEINTYTQKHNILCEELNNIKKNNPDLYELYKKELMAGTTLTGGMMEINELELKVASSLKFIDDMQKFAFEYEDMLKGLTDKDYISFYQKNYDYFDIMGITYDKYLSDVGKKVKGYSTNINLLEASSDFEENSLFLFYKAKELINNDNIPVSVRNELHNLITKKETYFLDTEKIEQLLVPYLSDNEKLVLNKIKGKGLKYTLDSQQLATVFQYTSAGGNDIVNIMRGRPSRSLLEIEEWANNYQLKQNTGMIRNISNDITIANEMENIIKQHLNEKPIQAVRYIENPKYFGIDLNNINGLSSSIGTTITDRAFCSFTLFDDAVTSYSKYPIKIIADIESKSGAFIQGASGLPTNLSEFLVLPNSRQTITDAYIDSNDGKIVIKTLVSLAD